MTEGVGRVIVDASTQDTLAVDSSGRAAIQNQPNMDVAASTLATSAKQDTLIGHVDGVETLLTSLDGKDFATQTTLAAILAQLNITLSALRDAILGASNKTLTDIETTLDAIKDTDGVKKITDQLPAGTNNIGAVDAWAHDGVGNEMSSVLNNSIRRLETRSSITAADGSHDVGLILDEDNGSIYRLQTEALTAPGSLVNIGTGIPSNPSDLVIEPCYNGSNDSLLVDGSVTPVVFTFGPSGTDVYALQELLGVFAADDFEFDGASFGPNTALTNGIEVAVVIDSVATVLGVIKQNEDWLRLPGRPPIVNNTGPKDILAASFGFGGLIKLSGSTSDTVRVTVRDDLTSVKFKYFKTTVYAVKE